MPRRGKIAKRDVLPDPLYNSKLVTRLINNVMIDGKKGVAQKIVYEAFDIIREKTGKEPLEVFEAAMENVMPVLEVKARRVGGATYQVPMEVRPERRQTLGLRWITLYSRQRSERTMKERLANEIMDAVNSTGSAFKKREDNNHCNPKAEWEALGSPDILTKSQVEEIKAKTTLKTEEIPFSASGGSTIVKLTVETNDVILLSLE